MAANKLNKTKLRSFGLIVGTGFALIAVAPALLRGQSLRLWALGVMGVLYVMAFACPVALKPFHRVWMAIGEILGWVNSRIILSVVYYLLIVPIGTIRRMTGSDAMRRKFEPDAATYKVPRSPRPSSHMQRQY